MGVQPRFQRFKTHGIKGQDGEVLWHFLPLQALLSVKHPAVKASVGASLPPLTA